MNNQLSVHEQLSYIGSRLAQMADATSALVSRFGYLLDDALFDDEQVQAHTLANGLSEEQARRQLVNAWVESGSKVVSAIGSRHGSQWLIDAVEHSRTEEAFALLSLGADPNGTDCTNADGWTALHLAAAQGHLALVRGLLAVPNMSVDALGSANRTPLLLACGARRYEDFDDEPAADGAEMQEVVRLLLGAHADPNLADVDECSPLMYAAPQCEAIVRMLLEAGADRDHVTYSGHRVQLPACMLDG